MENEKKYREKEMQYVKSIDAVSTNIAKKLGFSHVPWFTLTKIVLAIYSTLTCFVLFIRPDFVNLTVCTAATFMILNTDRISRLTFRLLVLGIFISMIIDLLWFFFTDFAGDTSDGGVEKSLKGFGMTMSYFSFFFRVR